MSLVPPVQLAVDENVVPIAALFAGTVPVAAVT